jgi:hypothetical protein
VPGLSLLNSLGHAAQSLQGFNDSAHFRRRVLASSHQIAQGFVIGIPPSIASRSNSRICAEVNTFTRASRGTDRCVLSLTEPNFDIPSKKVRVVFFWPLPTCFGVKAR